MQLHQHLARFGFDPTGGPEPPERIEELERLIGVPLPADYRTFLLEVGGGYVRDVLVPCTVPTPFGEHILTSLHSVSEIIELLDSGKTPRNMICISYGHFGMTGCLSMAGLDHGQIFSLDTEMRFYWDEETLSRLPALDSSIKEFFRMRDAHELPERPWGYENCYHIADSFTEFVSKMYLGTD
ncbi:MAG: SMI1/KNR4 family protein [Gemmataceae bacterium]